MAWTYFVNVPTASNSLIKQHTVLITKVYFPPVVIPSAPVLAAHVESAIASGMLKLGLLFNQELTGRDNIFLFGGM